MSEWKEVAAKHAEALSVRVAEVAKELLQGTIMPATELAQLNLAANSLARSRDHLDSLVRKLRGLPEPAKPEKKAASTAETQS